MNRKKQFLLMFFICRLISILSFGAMALDRSVTLLWKDGALCFENGKNKSEHTKNWWVKKIYKKVEKKFAFKI